MRFLRFFLLLLFLPLFSLLCAFSQTVPQTAAAPSPGKGASEPYRDRVRRQGPVMELSVQDALETALRNNLAIAIERMNVESAAQRLFGARGFYDPTLSFTANRSFSQSLGIFPRPAFSASRNSGLTPSVSVNLFSGGTVSASLGNSRSFSASRSSILDPTFASTLRIDFSQPLLQGALRGSSGVHQIRIAAYDTRIARESFRQRVIGIVQQVLSGYYELLFAIENYEVKRNSRDLAVIQLENTRLRVQSGLLAGSALTAARSEVMQREQDWIQSEVQIVLNQNALRNLLSAERSAEVWKATLLPSTPPDTSNPQMTLEEALESARRHRPELQIAALQRDESLENTRFAANQRLPRVNFTSSVTSPGQSGILVPPAPEDLDPATGPYIGGYGSSAGQALRFNAPGWSLGINVQFPLRNRSLEAQYVQSQIADRRIQAQARSTLLSVETNVMSTWESLVIQKNNVVAARLAHEAAQAQVDAITARFEANLATNFEVLSYQRDLAESRVRELRATIDYQNALNNLLVASGTLLEVKGVILPKTP